MPSLMSETSKDGQYLPDHVHVILISDNDSDDESSVESVILITEPANRDGPAVTRKVIEIIDLVDSEDDSCDDDSMSMQSVFAKEPCSFDLVDGRFSMETDETATEFMNKGLWIAGQENFQMADAKGIYRSYPPTPLGLSTDQVEMCRRDTEYYYNKYVETIFVKELQDMIAPGMTGFQEIRQRTSGRYDMQIPTLNTDKFFFLHDPNASWMPLVRKFLSNPNCALVHMGIILAMGKSKRQRYHVDGVHLHPTKHMPCYAVNVFFYLVDIHKKNGGTEFYLGSHKFREDDKDIRRAVRPLVKAGQPIIFDYRLGHLGLENTTDDIRPLLYLTYSGVGSDGEASFRDFKNFDETLPSLEAEVGLVPDRPGRGERAERRAMQT